MLIFNSQKRNVKYYSNTNNNYSTGSISNILIIFTKQTKDYYKLGMNFTIFSVHTLLYSVDPHIHMSDNFPEPIAKVETAENSEPYVTQYVM